MIAPTVVPKPTQFLRLEILEWIRNAVSVAQGLQEQALPLWDVESVDKGS